MPTLYARIQDFETACADRRLARVTERIYEIVGRGQAEPDEAQGWLAILNTHRRELLHGGENVEWLLRKLDAAEQMPE